MKGICEVTTVPFGFAFYVIEKAPKQSESQQKTLNNILKKLLIVGSSAPSHLFFVVLAYWDLEQILGIL